MAFNKIKVFHRCSYCHGFEEELVSKSLENDKVTEISDMHMEYDDESRDVCVKCLIKFFDRVLGENN